MAVDNDELVKTIHIDGSVINVFQPKRHITYEEKKDLSDFIANLLYRDQLHKKKLAQGN